jgi:hypothetical protein
MLNFRNRDKLLGVAALVCFIMGAANALEYFFAGIGYLRKTTGVVEQVDHLIHTGSRDRLYAETIVKLEGISKEYSLYDNAMEGGNLEVEKGDTVTLYIARFNQYLYNFQLKGNIFYASWKGGKFYNNTLNWKAGAFYYMCLFGGMAFFLTLMYLDQVKNISISNWFRKRFLNKKGY